MQRSASTIRDVDAKFSGASGDPKVLETFQLAVETQLRLSGLKPPAEYSSAELAECALEARFLIARRNLVGHALDDVVSEIPFPVDLGQLFQFLADRFITSTSRGVARTKFEASKQKAAESIVDYARDLKRVAGELGPEISPYQLRRFLVKSMDPALRTAALAFVGDSVLTHSSYEQVVQLLEPFDVARRELLLEGASSGSGLKSRSGFAPAAVSSSSQAHASNLLTSGGSGFAPTDRKSKVVALATAWQKANPTGPFPPPRLNATASSTSVCFHCLARGHFANTCSQPRLPASSMAGQRKLGKVGRASLASIQAQVEGDTSFLASVASASQPLFALST
jgi:hypothetical protein